jgi:hypothetical protein
LFPECFSEVIYVTFLPEQTRQLLLYLWRSDINTTKEAAIITWRKAYEPSEGQALPCKAMATQRRSDSRSEERSTSSFSRRAEIYLTPLHTQLGLIKIFVKVMNKEGEGFNCCQENSLGCVLKRSSNILGNKKIRKLRKNCGEATFLIPCLGMQFVLAELTAGRKRAQEGQSRTHFKNTGCRDHITGVEIWHMSNS